MFLSSLLATDKLTIAVLTSLTCAYCNLLTMLPRCTAMYVCVYCHGHCKAFWTAGCSIKRTKNGLPENFEICMVSLHLMFFFTVKIFLKLGCKGYWELEWCTSEILHSIFCHCFKFPVQFQEPPVLVFLVLVMFAI